PSPAPWALPVPRAVYVCRDPSHDIGTRTEAPLLQHLRQRRMCTNKFLGALKELLTVLRAVRGTERGARLRAPVRGLLVDGLRVCVRILAHALRGQQPVDVAIGDHGQETIRKARIVRNLNERAVELELGGRVRAG